MIIAGPVSDLLGVQVWFFVGGLITIGMRLSAFFIPAIMKLEEGRGTEQVDKKEEIALAAEPGD